MTKRLSTHEKLLREAKRLASKTNKRLRDLEKTYPDTTWSENILQGKLGNKDGLTPTGKVKANKLMSEAQLRNSIKAQKAFLKDKRSTVAGLEKVKRKLERSISKSLQTESKSGLKLSKTEADNMVQLFKEEEFNNMLKYVPPSEMWVMIQEARSQKIQSKKKFVDLFRSQYDFSENRGIRKALEEFYSNVYKQ